MSISHFSFCYIDVSVNGGWSTWSSWTGYIIGASARKRSCDNPELKDGGRYCPGYAIEVRMLHGGVLAPVGAGNYYMTFQVLSITISDTMILIGRPTLSVRNNSSPVFDFCSSLSRFKI